MQLYSGICCKLREQLKRLPGILSGLRKARHTLAETLEPAGPVSFSPSRDAAGDCGIQTTLLTDDAETMRNLLDRLTEAGITADSPLDSERHLFYNWETILSRRGAAHPQMDPYLMAANTECRRDYPADMLPRTRDIVARTIMIRHDPDWDDKDLLKTAETINGCIRAVSRT